MQTTREAALDSHVLAIIADYGRQKAQAFNMEFVKFQPSEFAEKLVSKIKFDCLVFDYFFNMHIYFFT